MVPDERPSVIAGDPNPQDTTGPASASPAAESTRRDGPSTQGVSSQIEELKAFYEDYAASLEGEISKLKGETTDLRAELSAARQSSAQLTTREVTQDDVPQVPEDERPPSSVEEAVKVAAAECENLLFLDEAFQSAAASAYLQPGKVLETLRTLNGVAERYRANDLPRGFKVACEETGLRYAADISQTAKGKYGRYYRRQYNGRSVMLGPHIQLGKGSPDTCARIYFYLDPAERLVVIGHVGKHLPDTNS